MFPDVLPTILQWLQTRWCNDGLGWKMCGLRGVNSPHIHHPHPSEDTLVILSARSVMDLAQGIDDQLNHFSVSNVKTHRKLLLQGHCGTERVNLMCHVDFTLTVVTCIYCRLISIVVTNFWDEWRTWLILFEARFQVFRDYSIIIYTLFDCTICIYIFYI